MPKPRQSMEDLFRVLTHLDGRPFNAYSELAGNCFQHDRYHLEFRHIQGSPGAFPASVCQLRFPLAALGRNGGWLSSRARKLATADYFLRAFNAGVTAHAHQNRGAQGSGSYQPPSLPPQVLERNWVVFDREWAQIAFHVSLPGSHDNRVLGRQATRMFSHELTAITDTIRRWAADNERLTRHCDTVEDMCALQHQLSRQGLVAFVGDGAILPRRSGVSQAPMGEGAVGFRAPDSLAVEVALPHSGRTRGLGIRPGVTIVIGAGFHGKSTLLNALVKGVYPHIPGDGRERVATHREAVFVSAEDGRAVTGLDLSGFIDHLPGQVDAARFTTQNASGSTSQAAAIIEAVSAGAKLLLIDEDASATNFLIKDHHMRELLPQDTITPLCDRVQELYQRYGVSTLMVVGGSSEYLAIADQVISMQDFLPVNLTDRVKQISLPQPARVAAPLAVSDTRRLRADNFNPAYHAKRLAKTIPVRIKPLRLQKRVLEFGDEQLDLTQLMALVDPQQALAVGYALLLARSTLLARPLAPGALAGAIDAMIETHGLDALMAEETVPLLLARPRRLEVAGAINRCRTLKLDNVTVQ